MQKVKALISQIAILAMLFSNTLPVFALGELPPVEPPPMETAPAPTPPPVETPPVVVTPPADTFGPAFISVSAVSNLETQANVVWTTDELAYGYVQYGKTQTYGQATPKSADLAFDHTVSITGLAAGTEYHYRIVAEDASGNISYSKDRVLETALEIIAIDNVPPEILEIDVFDVTQTSATIHWITNELAQGNVNYGKTASYGLATEASIDYATEHTVSLTDLSPGTEYHFQVKVQDESGNTATSFDEIFTTDIHTPAPTPKPETVVPKPQPEPVPIEATPPEPAFIISHVKTSSVTQTSATIVWDTNELASAQLFYGKDETYALSSLASTVNAASHKIKISNLAAGTNYFYKVVSVNEAGKTISKTGFEFTVLAKRKVKTAAPIISNVSISSITDSSAGIFFDTNMPATGVVNYGTTTGYEETDGGHKTLLTAHSHPLSGLMPDTLYNIEIAVQDALGNETIYKNVTFKTLSAAQQNSTPEPLPTNTAVVPADGGGGAYYYTPTHNAVLRPKITKVDALDKQVLFVWQSASKESGLKTIIIKQDNSYAKSLLTGDVIYRGNSGRFADTNLENGTTYHYSVFRVNAKGNYAFPFHFSVVPTAADTQTNIIAVPAVVQKNPIYTFSGQLTMGDYNKKVEHLQVLLASQPSLYPEGLITGYFGPLTKKAVKMFQQKHNLAPTGAADIATLKKLEALSSIEVANDKAALPELTLSRDLRGGYSGKDVLLLQNFLINYGTMQVPASGYFGQATKEALKEFQAEQNISPAYGYFGPITKQRMLNLIRLGAINL